VKDIKFDKLAIHYVDSNKEKLELSGEEQDITAFDQTIRGFLEDLVAEVWDAQDSGSNRSGHFVPAGHNLGPSFIQDYVNRIIDERDSFFESSIEIARHLYKQSPRTASPGLIVILRMIRQEDKKVFVSILKVRHKDEKFVVLEEILTQLEVEPVEKVLLKEIQKGSIIPHPVKEEYHIKTIDKISADEPARYFTENFLGSILKKSDEHQVKTLVPELNKYGQARDWPTKRERFPKVISDIQQSKVPISVDVIADAVKDNSVYGPRFKEEDFKKFLVDESDLGKVDIPPERFSKKGKASKTNRKITYTFSDPEYKGISISGLPTVVSKIISTDGDTVKFEIETTRDGFEEKYD